MKQITITPPDGYEIDKEKSTFEVIVFKEIMKTKSAKEWLIDFLNKNREKFTVKLGDNQIVYYLDDEWIFDLDLKNRYFWCSYYKIWYVFKTDYSMDYDQVQALIKDVLLKPFNCEGFTPNASASVPYFLAVKAFQL